MANRDGSRPRWTDEEYRLLEEHWPDLGSKKTAEIMGRPWQSVQQKALKLKLVCNQEARYRRHSKTMMRKNKSCDVKYFTREWTPNMAYIVGYIFADGCIQKDLYSVGFVCVETDEELLHAIKEELKSKHTIYYNPARIRKDGGIDKPRVSMNISCKKLVLSLVKRFGLLPGKTFLDLSMPEVPDEFFGHFLRGYFDGDGHVHARKECNGGLFNLVGTKTFIRQIRKRLVSMLGVRKIKVQQQGKIVTVNWGFHKDLKKIYRLIYPKSDESYIYLRRKRKVFRGVVKQTVMKKGPVVKWMLPSPGQN